MNGVQTRFKCKLDVKRCKRFVFPPSSLLPRSNALKTKAIRYFQTDRTLTRIVSPPLNIFFALNSAKIQDDQQAKLVSLIEYLETHPAAKISITGYADVNTGNPKINSKLSEKRAVNVAEALKVKGIAADRIKIDFKGDTVQPYATPEENRVSICIAE